MLQSAPTRMNLLALRRQREFALHGTELLRAKHQALLQELLAMAEPLIRQHAELAAALRTAASSLRMAQGLDGRPDVLAAALVTGRARSTRNVVERRVFGFALPVLVTDGHVAPNVPNPATTTARVAEAAVDFDAVVRLLLELGPAECRLQRLSSEVQRTSRRIHALEHILLPSMARDIDGITRVLEELERDDDFRLRRVKRRKGRGGGTCD